MNAKLAHLELHGCTPWSAKKEALDIRLGETWMHISYFPKTNRWSHQRFNHPELGWKPVAWSAFSDWDSLSWELINELLEK